MESVVIVIGGLIVVALLSALTFFYRWKVRDWQFFLTGVLVMFYTILCVGYLLLTGVL